METDPMKALEIMCHTSQRGYNGTVYTIEDIRYPDFNGKKILITLEYGKNKAEWFDHTTANGQKRLMAKK